MNCIQAFIVLRRATCILFPNGGFPRELISYLAAYYFAITEPLAAVSSAATCAVLRGNLFLRATGRPGRGENPGDISRHVIRLSMLFGWNDADRVTAIACADSFIVFIANSRVFECKLRRMGPMSANPTFDAGLIPVARYLGGNRVISISCGEDHTAAVGWGPSHTGAGNNPMVQRVYTWGSNAWGQMASTNSGDPRPVWTTHAGSQVAVICLMHATLLLTDGVVWYSGKISIGIPQVNEWSKLRMTVQIGTILSVRLMNYRVVFRNERGLTYAIIGSERSMADITRFEPYKVSGNDDALSTVVHHEGHIAYTTARNLTLDDEIICNWDELGGR